MSRLRHNRILPLLFFCAVAVVLTCTFRLSKSRFIRHVTLNARRHESIEYTVNPLVLLLGSPITAQANKASSLIQPRDGAWDTVVDAGAFDAVDYTIPAFQNGYNVYSFEVRDGGVLARAVGLVVTFGGCFHRLHDLLHTLFPV